MAPDAAAPLVLAIDAATYVGSAAVLRGRHVVAAREVAMRGEREERLMPAVAEVLAEAGAVPGALALVACGGGPGSFTSLRIAGAIAKGLASAVPCRLVALPSLALAVARPGARREAGRWLAVLDAMRGERYAALVTLASEASAGAAGAPAGGGPPGVQVVGYEYLGVIAEGAASDLAERHQVRGVVDAGAEPPSAAAAAAFALEGSGARGALAPAAVDLGLWEPDYGRKAEAQVKWEAQHGRVLPADTSAVAPVGAIGGLGGAAGGVR